MHMCPRKLAFGNLLRIHSMQNGHRIDEERLSIDAPETDFSVPSKWTVTIENGNDAPLTIKSVSLQMLERRLCFDAFLRQLHSSMATRRSRPQFTTMQLCLQRKLTLRRHRPDRNN